MSDMPSIMRTVTPSQSATPASISERAKSVAQSVKKSVTPVKNDGGVDIIKIVLIVAIVGFLAYNLYLYFTEGTDVLGKYFGIGITGAAKGTEVAVDTVAEGTKDTVSIAQNVTNKGLDAVAEGGEEITKKSESPIERQLDEEENTEKEAENIDANSSFASNLKKTVKGGYCYIGTDRTFRSCVKVDPGDICMSKKIFPTEDICINPNLRR
jgi:flagellar biogenesis protein FliO